MRESVPGFLRSRQMSRVEKTTRGDPPRTFAPHVHEAVDGIPLAAVDSRKPGPPGTGPRRVKSAEPSDLRKAPMRNRDRFLPIILISLALTASARLHGSPPAETSGQDKESGKESGSGDRRSEENNPYEKRFQELDRNQDGYVSLAEWPLDPPRFHRVDRNQDGRLSRRELMTPNVLREYGKRILNPEDTGSPRVTPRNQRRFRELDRNRDNRLSRLEWTGLETRFDYLDRNRDGFVSLYEEWPQQSASPPPE